MHKTRKIEYEMASHNPYRTPSTFMPGDTAANPYYDKVDALWDTISSGGALDSIASIVEKFIGPDGVFDEVGYLRAVEEMDILDDLLDVYEETPEVSPTLPPAPSPKQLYNRVADVQIVDIGSGDCSKLSRCQAVSIVATDREPVSNAHYQVAKLDAEEELMEFMLDKPDRVLTSFNALSQMVNVERVLEYDGLHVLPDISAVKTMMEAGFDEKGAYYGDYKDRDNGLVGDLLADGYVALNTYEQTNVRLKPIRKVKTLCPKPQISTVYYRPPDAEATPKYDGVCMFLICQGGVRLLAHRNGNGYEFDGGGGCPEMVLMLEKLPRIGPPTHFVLLRVYQYKRYYPFHGLNNLRMFCKKVNIRLGGIRIYAPGDRMLAHCPVDGQIFRIGQLDYRYKSLHTVDLYDPQAMADQLEKKYGYSITVDDVPPCELLKEYEVHNYNGRYEFKFKLMRNDKTEATSFDAISRMLQWI